MPKTDAELRAMTDEWLRENPDHCPECFCRPGKGDADDGSDHERYCSKGLAMKWGCPFCNYEGPSDVLWGRAATQTVEHLHIHIVPRSDGDGLQLPWSQSIKKKP